MRKLRRFRPARSGLPGEVDDIVEGDANPTEFIPNLIERYRQGKFPFDELVTYYDFDEIQAAVEASEEGTAIKPILRVSEP